MRKIACFVGEKITIDDKVGTLVVRNVERGFYDFVYRTGGEIQAVTLAARLLRGEGDGHFVVREEKRRLINQTAAQYPSQMYQAYDKMLRNVGL